MQKAVQVENIKKLIEHLGSNTTAMAEAIYRNRVSQYICPEELERERGQLFRRYPLHIGFSCELREPGDYMTDDFSGVPVLLVRGDDGKARAFMNVCRHRGAPVADGCGNGKQRFVCPYHAWVYGIDGQLKNIPGDEGFVALDRKTHGLRALPVAEKYGMIWVKTTPGEDFNIDDYLQDARNDIASYGFDQFHHFETRVLRPKMNWKLVIDTFLESYHIRVLHRNTIDPLIISNVATFDALGDNLRTIYMRKNFEKLTALPESQWNILPYTTIVYVLFPNTVLIVQQEQIETWRIYPDGDDPNAAKMHISIYTPQASETESATRHWRNNMDLLLAVVNEEDFPLGEKMQRGFHSGAQDHLTFGRNEPALGHFHRSLELAVV